MDKLSWLTVSILETIAYLFIYLVIIAVLWLFGAYIYDKRQTNSTLRRNYPVIARFRYFFEHLGEFFRQYFFAHDREEMPFNRAERSWIYRAAKNIDSTIAFGSTRDLRHVGTILFANCAFPKLTNKKNDDLDVITIGKYSKNPYKTSSIFNISGMSYGAISIPAVKALSYGAKTANIWLNTGEGGLSDYHLEGGADIVFQIGTAKFGVCKKDGGFDERKLKKVAGYEQVKMFEIKLSQGAKPGKGGILPGAKVNAQIAKIRGIEEGKDAISPNRHPEIENINNLLDMVSYVRDITQKPVGFKTVIGDYGWIEDLCKKIKKKGIKSAPDFITIDSADGGTGAAPMSLMDNVGIPIKESLPVIVNILEKYKLKERIKIIASGKLVTPAEVSWALCVGADFIVSARGFMFALGCIQALQCNKNTCPTGITTHNKKLQYGLNPQDKALRVAQYAKNMNKEIAIIANSCGVDTPRDLNRSHARIVIDNGKSIRMDEFYKKTA